MYNKTILVIDKNEAQQQDAIIQVSNNQQWSVIGADSEEYAIEKFHQVNIDLVLLAEIKEEEEKKLRKIFTHQNPDVLIMHFPLDRDSLNEAIEKEFHRLQQKNKPSFAFVDDALKNAGLNISLQ